MRKRSAAFIAAVFCAAAVFSSCAETARNETAEVKPLPEFTLLNKSDDENAKNIYIIVKNIESSYWKVILDGAAEGGKENDCNVYASGILGESDWQGQATLIDRALDAGADALVFAPNDSVMLADKLDEVYAKGVPIVLVDTIANTESYDICYMTDNLMAGQQAAEEMISLLHEKGFSDGESLSVGIQVGATSSQTINERLAGFCQYWSNNAPENWEIITDIKCNDGDTEYAVELAEELLDDNPSIKGLFGSNNGSTVGLAKTVKERQRTDIVLVGFDYSDEMAELISSEEYTAATVLQRQFDMSRQGIGSAMEILGGGRPDVKFVDTGVLVVARSSLNEPEVQEVLEHNQGK